MIAVICLKTLLNIIIIIIITIYYSLRKIQLCFFLFDMTLPNSNICSTTLLKLVLEKRDK